MSELIIRQLIWKIEKLNLIFPILLVVSKSLCTHRRRQEGKKGKKKQQQQQQLVIVVLCAIFLCFPKMKLV